MPSPGDAGTEDVAAPRDAAEDSSAEEDQARGDSDVEVGGGCAVTGDCPAGAECARIDAADPLTLECGAAACGCGPDAWCDEHGQCRTGSPCESTQDCGGGRFCVESGHECQVLCETNRDCPDELECRAQGPVRTCDWPDCRCTSPDDFCQPETGCVRPDTANCADDGCPTALVYRCDPAAGCVCDEERCTQCNDASDCDPTQKCSDTGRCHDEFCRDDEDCSDDEVCGWVESVGAVCVASGQAAVGEGCSQPSDCESGVCAGEQCVQPCFNNADCATGRCVELERPSMVKFRGRCVDTNCDEMCSQDGQICTADQTSCSFPGCFTTEDCGTSGVACVTTAGSYNSGCSAQVSCSLNEVFLNLRLACVERCLGDLDCDDDEVCRGYVCTKRCATACDCEVWYGCVDGACVATSDCRETCDPDAYCDALSESSAPCGEATGACADG